MGRLTAAIAACAIATATTGCGRSEPPVGPSSFTAGGVRVTVTTADGAVVARFAPVRPGFHLYSIDLPPGGIDGLGQRTELTVSGGLRPAGKLSADRPTRPLRYRSLDIDLPVYPDGPVTARLPVRAGSNEPTVATISFAACNESVCLPPVRDRRVTIPD
jgi:hypothetical protein